MKKVFVLCLTVTAALLGAGLEPYGLECEARHNPVGVDAAGPRLSWKLKSDQQNQKQSAYQILVAPSPEELAANSGGLWDSGRVSGDQSIWVEYKGAVLKSFGRYYWKVRVWDASGQPSAWSQPAEWTMAVLDPSAWKARWISHPDSSLRSGPLPLFRKEIVLDRPVRRALALVSGAGFHELRINGVKAGDHVLAPAWTNYRATIFYETLDITSLLKTGPNAVGVLLGNGFFNVAGGRYVKYTGSFGHPRLFAQIHLEYEDGTAANIGSDNSWRVQNGPITFSCIYGGEDYDARLEPSGWDRPGFDDSSWRRASGADGPGGVMRAQSSPPIRVQQTFRPVKVTEPRPGTYIYDLGQNFAGWPKITVSGPSGASVRFTSGELLDSAGLVTQRSSGGPTYFTYTLNGQGQQTWSPRFSYTGFRYIQVEGAAPAAEAKPGTAALHEVAGEFIHLDAPRTGQFSTSHQLFNRIHNLIDAAVRSNLQHVLSDCPHREKLGWLEQAHLMGPSLLYNWDLRTFLPKILQDMREAQLVSGLIPDIAPEYVVFSRGFRDSPEWGSAGVIAPWLAWQWYGDRAPLSDSWKMMKAYTGYLDALAKDGILSHGLGDWYDIGPKPPGTSQLTPLGLTATAVFAQDLQVMRSAANLLGLQADEAAYASKLAEVRRAFERAFYKPAESSYATGSQTSLAMPLFLGLAPDSVRPALVDGLVADIRKRGNHTSAGDVGYRYVVGALLDAGRSDVLFDLANQPNAPSYAAQLAAGATALTEAWDANPNSSHNHLMLGHIEQWFYAGLAGIRPDRNSPGASHVRIQPNPVGGIEWVKASWESVRGPVAVDWRVENGSFRLNVEIPPGMTADVQMPGGQSSTVGSGRHQFVTRNFQAN